MIQVSRGSCCLAVVETGWWIWTWVRAEVYPDKMGEPAGRNQMSRCWAWLVTFFMSIHLQGQNYPGCALFYKERKTCIAETQSCSRTQTHFSEHWNGGITCPVDRQGHERATKWTHSSSKVCERNYWILIVQTWSKMKLFYTQTRVTPVLIRTREILFPPVSYGPGCCFVMKNGWRRAGGMLSQSLLEQAGPFLSTKECPVLWVFVLALVTPCQASSSLFLFYHPHTPFRPSKFSSAALSFISFYTGFFVGSWFVEQTGSGMLSQHALRLRGRSRVLQGVPQFFCWVCVFLSVIPGTIWVLN